MCHFLEVPICGKPGQFSDPERQSTRCTQSFGSCEEDYLNERLYELMVKMRMREGGGKNACTETRHTDGKAAPEGLLDAEVKKRRVSRPGKL